MVWVQSVGEIFSFVPKEQRHATATEAAIIFGIFGMKGEGEFFEGEDQSASFLASSIRDKAT